MAETELSLLITLKDQASAQLAQFNAAIKANGQAIEEVRKYYLAFSVAAGAAITGVILAAEGQREANARLSNSLKNIGVDYNAVATQINTVTEASLRYTGVSTDDQLAALNKLIIATGSYTESMRLLPTVLDLAAAANVDVTTAAMLLGKVAEGNTTVLSRYGIVIKEGTTASQALAVVTEKVRGAAEATANPLNVLKGEIEDMAAKIGDALLPALQYIVDKIVPIIKGFGDWAQSHQTLIKMITGLVVVLIGAGGLFFAFVQIVKAIQAVAASLAVVQALMGPAGWITLAAGLAAAAGAIYMIGQLTGTPEQPGSGGGDFSGPPDTWPKSFTGFAVGGIVTSPTRAMIGEAGPEAVIPLNRAGGIGGVTNNVTVNVQGSIHSQQDLMNVIRQELVRMQYRNRTTGIV